MRHLFFLLFLNIFLGEDDVEESTKAGSEVEEKDDRGALAEGSSLGCVGDL